ncbi:MAG: hypothetical protein DM484_19305 [Candidatus Methylumidiphilus alinenensis]|uniref:Uncharacterized protein n=1 Tax=Candidatus Methylumidiphilus alinenensis TaxID=2202197 RepID=A0A2W4SID9_9GAMM|nr:MAG: hypothetical protein DM484_19305 [Candidatus Methylumidiphilus alinenensis]
MLQFQRRFNNLIDDLVKAETHHQFILAHEITIRIHQLGFELTQTKKPIYEWVGIMMKQSCGVCSAHPADGMCCESDDLGVKSIDAITSVTVQPPLPFPGSAAILAAILAGGTPALPRGAERLHYKQLSKHV